jgi:hypothetical protein
MSDAVRDLYSFSARTSSNGSRQPKIAQVLPGKFASQSPGEFLNEDYLSTANKSYLQDATLNNTKQPKSLGLLRQKYLQDGVKNEENLRQLMASIKTTRGTPTSRMGEMKRTEPS